MAPQKKKTLQKKCNKKALQKKKDLQKKRQ